MVELIWDAGCSGTATVPSGSTAHVGDQAAFSPDDLLAMSASACLMRTFLTTAAMQQIPVLSYASTARVGTDADGRPTVGVRAYVTAGSTSHCQRLRPLFAEARQQSRICGLLGDRLTAELDLKALPDAAPRS